jgi:polysaccharide biosynthesis transport protein
LAAFTPALAASSPRPATPVATTSAAATQLATLDASIATAENTLGPNHPDLTALRSQRARLAETVARETAQNQAAVTSASSPVADLYNQQQTKVLSQRGLVAEAQRLAADVTVLRNQFNESASRAGQLQQQAQSIESGLTLLGSAVAPQKPAFPNMLLIIPGSLLFGLALGVLLALIMELLYRRVRGIEDLVMTGVPVIGVMAKPAL